MGITSSGIMRVTVEASDMTLHYRVTTTSLSVPSTDRYCGTDGGRQSCHENKRGSESGSSVDFLYLACQKDS